eukprot:scaffold4007_cov111-Cylindrotheca_fusiformis.AAC.3
MGGRQAANNGRVEMRIRAAFRFEQTVFLLYKSMASHYPRHHHAQKRPNRQHFLLYHLVERTNQYTDSHGYIHRVFYGPDW